MNKKLMAKNKYSSNCVCNRGVGQDKWAHGLQFLEQHQKQMNFRQTLNQGSCQLFLTVSWDLGA